MGVVYDYYLENKEEIDKLMLDGMHISEVATIKGVSHTFAMKVASVAIDEMKSVHRSGKEVITANVFHHEDQIMPDKYYFSNPHILPGAWMNSQAKKLIDSLKEEIPDYVKEYGLSV